MNIIVPDYEILNFDTESLIVSDFGISKIHSEGLLKVLRQLQLSNGVTRAEIDGMLSDNGLNISDAFGFLERVIPFKTIGEMYFEKIIVVHEWEGKADFELIFRRELSDELEFKGFSSDLVDLVAGVRCFIVLVCQSYDYDSLKKVYFDLAEASPQSAISVSWSMGDFFCIGQPYIAEAGSPCHFCTVDRLVNNHAFMPGGNSWGKVLAFCKGKHISVPSKVMSLYQELVVIGSIIRKIKFFTEVGSAKKYQDNVLHLTYLQLSDGRIFEEPNSHWYMCDCLEVGS